MARVQRSRMLGVFGVLGAVFVPLAALILFDGAPPTVLLVFLLPLLLVGGTMAVVGRRANRAPSVAYVTNRRVIVETSGPAGTSASMGLETLGNVELQGSNWAARRAGVDWVYLMPAGTTEVFVGAGRGRSLAPGVLFLPAVPKADAEMLRDVVLRTARDVQSRLGMSGLPAP